MPHLAQSVIARARRSRTGILPSEYGVQRAQAAAQGHAGMSSMGERYAEHNILSNPDDYAFAKDAHNTGSAFSKRLMREMVDWQSLNTPQGLRAFGADVYLRVDPTNACVLKAMIVGPPDTPYEMGLFEFDILLTTTYPMDPPKVLFKTTAGGTVHFNWNLYMDGKVCLSLLGTWVGPEWTPACQVKHVLLAIGSIIMNATPYFNEPGWEEEMGTPEGTRKSIAYNAQVREATVKYAMTRHISHPPAAFGDVVAAHFRANADKIRGLVEKWTDDAPTDVKRCYRNLPVGDRTSMNKSKAELFRELSLMRDATGIGHISDKLASQQL